MASYKHGLTARVVTAKDALRYRLEGIDPNAPQILEAFVKAIGGDARALDAIMADGMASTEVVRRKMLDEIERRGVVVEDVMIGSDGKELGRRVRANPVLEPLQKANEQLGMTAADLRLTKKSRGEGERDDALASALRRDAQLRAGNKGGLPAADIEVFRPN